MAGRSVAGSTMLNRVGTISCSLLLVSSIMLAGCRAPNDGRSGHGWGKRKNPRIRRVVCIYGQRPWLNLDKDGDRDPEGLRFRVFLDTGDGRGVLVDGTFRVEMYVVERQPDGELTRTLSSDWVYPSHAIHTIAKPGMLGEGYFLYLYWSNKSTAGKEIEIVVEFEDEAGNKVRSGTKRLRVPKYTT